MGKFSNKTAIITGGSRGIGRCIALMLAQGGANVVLAAKTKNPHEFLEGTIGSVAAEVITAGGKALPFQIDVRDASAIDDLVAATVKEFGGIDILINNAGAIYLTDTQSTDAKQFDLMHGINVRATFLMSRACFPYLAKKGGHILNLSPPISLDAKWISPHVAYTISKYGMSLCTLGMAEEFASSKVAVNSLWPRTLIYTAAITRLMGESASLHCRKPSIIADAAEWILAQPPSTCTGNLFLDEEVLKKAGITEWDKYCFGDNSEQLMPDLYVDP
jgi:NAD(P)-dependent dehydrogenase (short-subunit alcohol dehydrogenase family)